MLNRNKDRSNNRRHFARIGELPPHEHHQAKAHEQKDETADAVLDANHLMVGRKNVFTPKSELVVVVFVSRLVMMSIFAVRVKRSGSVHFGKKLTVQYRKGKTHCKVRI